MEACTVITIKGNIVQDVELFTGFTVEEVAKLAKDCFRKVCQNTSQHVISDEDMEACIKAGYWDSKDGLDSDTIMVAINWPNRNIRAIRPIRAETVEVEDPEKPGLKVSVEVWKDQISGGLFGIDSSFLYQKRCVGIPSPFNARDFFDLREEDDYKEPPTFKEDEE